MSGYVQKRNFKCINSQTPPYKTPTKTRKLSTSQSTAISSKVTNKNFKSQQIGLNRKKANVISEQSLFPEYLELRYISGAKHVNSKF